MKISSTVCIYHDAGTNKKSPSMNIDFAGIKAIDGSQASGFEEFVCQIANHAENIPLGSIFCRFRGAGGDGGVECIWILPNGDEWGWQSKYLFDLDKDQLDRSVTTAIKVHPKLTRYFIALPFNLTGPTSKRGKSQTEKYEAYRDDWKRQAKDLGRDVEFELIDKSKLIDELTRIDTFGGKLRFWFDQEGFADDWFKRQIEDAIRAAGPRYTPILNIKTPIAEVFEAFGRTPIWKEKVAERILKFREQIDHWKDCLNNSDWNGKKDFPEKARAEGESLLEKLGDIQDKLGDLYPRGLTAQELSDFAEQVLTATSLSDHCRDIAKAAVEAEHGKGKADSVGFKQFMQEYQVSFPTRHYDAAREIGDLLRTTLDWFAGPIPRLPGATAFLLIGPAGIGKTHSICDMAAERYKRGLKSIVLLGHQFSDEEPWTQVKRLLGLADSTSREQLLSVLDTAGEATGSPVIVFVDALNETEPRNIWTRHLSTLVEQVKRYRWVKLCLSCRSSFIEDVVPDHLELLQVEHTGFEGVEFDACFEFFRFYGIDPPSMPLLQPEYLNPLFLKLVCESLRDAGQRKLPSGIMGFDHLIKFLFAAKNRKLAKALDYDEREERVHAAMDVLTEKMHDLHRPWLHWNEAKQLVESHWPSSQWSESLFNNLIKENLLKEDRAIDPDSGEVVDTISVSFERLGDHIIVSKYLTGIPDVELLEKSFRPDGNLHFLAQDSYSVHKHKSLIEALAIQVPEKYGVELDKVLSVSPAEIEKAIVDSLQWRDSSSVKGDTEIFLEQLIEDSDTRSFLRLADALLAIAPIDDHPLNANWLHAVLSKIPLVKRDGKLSPYLHLTYGKQRNVDRLLRWGLRAELGGVTTNTAKLWLTVLCWFASASDRRVRDYATKAMVNIGGAYPEAWPALIEQFASVDDDYVIERCLAAAYGVLLRSSNQDAAQAVSRIVFRVFFENGLLRQNALVIDYARLIIERAVYLGATKDLDPSRYTPPYSGDSKLEWPDEKFVEEYKDKYWELPKLHTSCMNDDFQHYTVPSVIRRYEGDGVELLSACRWVFKHVLEMGYAPDSDAAEFDRYILSKYGGGRGRPAWAERIGKKYQWIALYRLAAKLSFCYPDRDDYLSPASKKAKSLLAQDERNIDPSILERANKYSKKRTWWAPVEYKFVASQTLSDAEWLDRVDFPDNSDMLLVGDKPWLVLQTNYNWEDREHGSRNGHPGHMMWLQLRSFLVGEEEAESCWKWLKRQDFMGGWMPTGYQLHDGFLGEYPWATPFAYIRENDEDDQRYSQKEIPCKLISTANDLTSNFSFDAYQEDAINTVVPSDKFFDDPKLEWDSVSGYQDNDRTKVFYDPALEESGQHALLADRDYLCDFLTRNNLVLFWTVLGEKQAISGSYESADGYLQYSRAYALRERSIEASRPIVKRVTPRLKGKS